MTTIPLTAPIILRAKETGAEVMRIAEVTFRKPLAGDLVAAMDAGSTGNGSMIAALCARCTGLTIDQVAGLEIEDFMAMTEIATGFLPSGLGTGKTALPSSSAPSASPAIGKAGPPPNSAS